MKNRDDSFLYTGVSSASARANETRRDQMSKDKAKERVAITPAGEIVNELIESELAYARNIENLVVDVDASEDTYKALHIARRMNIEFIKSFQTKLNHKLRVPRTQRKEAVR